MASSHRRPVLGDYMDWAETDYRPPEQMLPDALLPHLTPGMSVLDIGCHGGEGTLFIAERSTVRSVEGLDLNLRAIARASRRAAERGLADRVKFTQGDILETPLERKYDVVALTRVFTCFASESSWDQLLRRCQELLVDGGLLYVRDFVMDPANPAYRDRYERAHRQGWREGNFAVTHDDGRLQMIVHHHTKEELETLTAGFDPVVEVRFREALSMNGNKVTTFEFIGRKRPVSSAGTLSTAGRVPAFRSTDLAKVLQPTR